MHLQLIDPQILGIAILVLLGFLVICKRMSSGSILDRPRGGFLIQLVNGFNLFFLLVLNPLTALLLVTDNLEIISPTRIIFEEQRTLLNLEITGLALYVLGFFLMVLSLIKLGRNYQLGGSTPLFGDKMIVNGPYKRIRHPMYTAALSISLGLALLTPSWVYWGFFGFYLILIILLIPLEEKGLQEVYGQQYAAYQQKVRKLIPFIY